MSLRKKKTALVRLRGMVSVLTVAVMVFTLAASITPFESFAESARGLDSVTHTQEEIRKYYQEHPISEEDFVMSEQPSVKAPYKLGKVSQASLQSALNLLNMYRYIEGVEPVQITNTAQEYAQAGALLCAINHRIAHGMSAPSDMDSALAAKCTYGTANSNLAGGGTSLTGMIRRFMLEINGDPDYGHRRQLLKYEMTETGFGAATSDTNGNYMAAFVDAYMKDNKFLSYPGENQPLEFFGTGYAWTVSVPERNVDPDSVKVKLTEETRNAVYTCSIAEKNMRVDKDSSSACIIFAPDKIKYREGDRYKVEITGIPTPVTYYVNMFFVADKIPVESVESTGIGGITIYADPDGTGTGAYSNSGTLSAKVLPENASNKNLDWYSSDPEIAYPEYYGSSSCKAVGMKPGEVTFTAVSEDGGYSHEFTVTVRPKAEQIIAENEYTIGVGQSMTLKPEVLPKESQSRAYYKSNYDKSVMKAEDTRILGEVKITGLNKGSTNLTFYANSNYAVEKTCRINVVDPVYVTKIKLNKDKIELKTGETFQLEASVEPSNATLKDVEWVSADRNIARVDKNGLVSLGYSYGTTTITAKALDGKGASAVCEVTRHKHELEKTAAVPASCEKAGTLAYWTCKTCGDMFSDSYGSKQITEPVVDPAKGHSWRSTPTVDKNATCTEPGVKSIHCLRCEAVQEGSEEVIPALGHQFGQWKTTKEPTVAEEGERQRTCQRYGCGFVETEKIEKLPPDDTVYVTKINLNEDSIELKNGESFQLEASVEPANATFKDVEWESADRSIARVDKNGLVTLGYSNGTTTITARAVDGSGVTAVCEVSRHRHQLEEVDAVPAGCVEPGTKAYWACKTCGDMFSDSNGSNQITEPPVDPAKGHSWRSTPTVDKSPTCTMAGVKSIHCSRCEAVQGGSEEVIPALGHQFGQWRMIKEPTVDEEGEIQRTCQRNECGFTETEKLDKLTSSDPGEPTVKPTPADTSKETGENGTAIGKGASAAAADAAIRQSKTDDPPGAAFGLLRAKASKVTKKSVKIAWSTVPGAKKYVVYGNRCGKQNKYKKLKVTTAKSLTFKKVAGAKVKKGKYYKFIVVAVDANNKVITTSKTIHTAIAGGKAGNDKKVITAAKKNKVTLAKGSTFKLKAKAKPASKKHKVKRHRKMAYETSNGKVATVTSGGVIKGVGKGSCYVYAYAQNGVYTGIIVTVK